MNIAAALLLVALWLVTWYALLLLPVASGICTFVARLICAVNVCVCRAAGPHTPRELQFSSGDSHFHMPTGVLWE
jgi:hypothetical protein